MYFLLLSRGKPGPRGQKGEKGEGGQKVLIKYICSRDFVKLFICSHRCFVVTIIGELTGLYSLLHPRVKWGLLERLDQRVA